MTTAPERDIEAAAAALFAAESRRRQIGLLSRTYPAMTMDDAYAVQAALVRRKLADGRRIIGWKIGLTSRAMQDALKIDTPDSGVLFDDMQFADGATIAAGRFIQPRIEAEIAFLMGGALDGPGVTAADVLAATAAVAPSLEILDTRILRTDPETGASRTIVDTIADNAANAAIVLGGRPMRPDAVDWRWAGALLYKNGVIEESGLGAAVLNHPGNGVAWLANKLAAHGESLAAGEIVLAGSFTRPVACAAGDTFHADYGPLGSISVRFA